jgi:polyhydroxyalkanoate synthesis regulator phasin
MITLQKIYPQAKETTMIDIVKKTLLAGIGLALKTKDEVEDLAREIEKKFNLTEKDGKKFLKELHKKYDETQEKLEDRADDSVKKFLKKMDIVTSEDLKGLKKEIRDLKKMISETTDTLPK